MFQKIGKLFLAIMLLMTAVFSTACETGDKNGELMIEKGDKNNPTYTFVTDGELSVSTVSKQDTINKLSATDDFGRSFGYIDGYKTDKERYVGIFYFTWLGYHGGEMNGIYDVTKLIDENPNALWNTNGTSESPLGKYHYWGEPLYGYYNSRDPWVIRKHIELFTLSGIDFIAFDCTNGFDYIEVVSDILPIMQEMYDEGWEVPKFMFYLNSLSGKVIKDIYSGRATASSNPLEKEGIYKKGHYKDLWFAPNGKPRIAAITDPQSTNGEGSADKSLHIVSDPEILSFFEFWESQWPNQKYYDNGLPWMEWARPQPVHTDTINVSVAQHNHLPFSDALLSSALADEMWGRGYTTANGTDHSDEAIESGLNFEEQWQNALKEDVKYTFVTGWNEWVAIKSAAALGQNSSYSECKGKRVYFVDTVNKEYSRDIEMMKGGYADNYYLQLTRNIRTLKGKTGTLSGSEPGVIDITKGMSQWNAVSDVYYDFTGEINRDYKGFVETIHYKDDSLVNDIAEIRVTHDSENIYVLVDCTAPIVADPETGNWMNLLIDVDGQENDSFYGYDYIINRQSSYTGQCSVEQFGKAGSNVKYNLKGIANFTLNGNYMQFKIPKSALNITGAFTLRFKVADHVTDSLDMESYYTTGDVAPVGRLNYIFSGK